MSAWRTRAANAISLTSNQLGTFARTPAHAFRGRLRGQHVRLIRKHRRVCQRNWTEATHTCLKWFSPGHTSPLRSACLRDRTGHRRTFLAAALGARGFVALRDKRSSVRDGASEACTEYATSGRLREDQPRLEAAAAAHGRGNQGQVAADLFHHTVDDRKPETAAGAHR
jgi:hypothetical protein